MFIDKKVLKQVLGGKDFVWEFNVNWIFLYSYYCSCYCSFRDEKGSIDEELYRKWRKWWGDNQRNL